MRKWNKLLALLLAMVMAFGMTVTAFAEGEADAAATFNGSIVILHTNDVHGAIDGYAKVAALKAKYEAEGAYVLLMDAGDFSQGEPTVSVSEGATAVELMNMAGYDVAAPGNHEFDYGYDNLVKLAEAAEFPILAANINKDGKLAFGDNVTFEAPDGTKIGVFGLDTPETASKAHPGKIKGVTFASGEEMYKIAQAQVDELTAAGCDYIVCLGHLGIDEETAATANRSIDLLENVTGIDVFIDGHSHSTLEDITAATNETRTVGDTVLTSTGTKVANVGVITIKDGKITTECVAADTIEVAADDAIAARAAEIQAEIDADYGAVFATTEVRLNGDRDPGNRTEETNLGNLITDALVWKAAQQGEDVDAAITNGGGIRATIEAGDITKKDINTVLPFGNTLNIIKIKGSELLEVLEASTYCTPTAIGGFPQVSGIEFTINTLKAFDQGEVYGDTTYYAPKTINRVSIQTVGGEAFDPDATYTIATNDFMASGGDTYYAFTTATANYDLGIPMDEVVMEYITTVLEGKVTAEQYGETEGRITIKGYSDVTAANWYCDAVAYATDKGLIDAVDGAFMPNEAMTRADFVTALYRLAGSPEVTGENPFTDVADDAAYKDAVIWANQCGYVTGMTDTTFEPTSTLQRQQIAAILYRAVKPETAEGDLSVFSDAGRIQSYATDAMKWMIGVELLKGDDKGLIDARGSITRAQVATILQRFEEKGLTFASVEETEETPAYIETTITFEVAAQDGIPARTVTGILTVPTSASKDAPVPGVVMLHGTGSNMHEVNGAYDTAAIEMAKSGIATLRFNFAGIDDGKEAEYVNYSYTSANLEAKAAADYLAKLDVVDGEKLGVMGWSQGGTNALLAAAAYPETFKAVVTWAGALDLTTMFEDFDAAAAEAKENGSWTMAFDWRTDLPFGSKWFEDVAATDVLAKSKEITAPILTINGAKDDVVDPASGKTIADAAQNSLSKNLVIEDCDHTLNMFTGDDTAINTVIAATAEFFAQILAGTADAAKAA